MINRQVMADVLNNNGFRIFDEKARASFPGSIKKFMDFAETNLCRTFLKKDKEKNNYLLLLQNPKCEFEFVQFNNAGKNITEPELDARLTAEQVIAYITKHEMPKAKTKTTETNPVKNPETNEKTGLAETLNKLKTEDEIVNSLHYPNNNVLVGTSLTPEIISKHEQLITEISQHLIKEIPLSTKQKEELLLLLKTENPQITELRDIKALDEITNDIFGKLYASYSFKSSVLNNKRAEKINELLGFLYRNNNSTV